MLRLVFIDVKMKVSYEDFTLFSCICLKGLKSV